MPAVLGRIHGTRNTPHVAIGTLLVLVLILALSGGEDAVKQLASSTALLLLFSFMVVNSALVVLKLRPGEPHGQFEVPIFVPVLGILVNLDADRLAALERRRRRCGPRSSPAAIVVIVTILYFVLRPKNITDEALAALEE